MATDQKGAAVKFPPPLIFLLFMLLGQGLQYVWPVTISSSLVVKLIGVGLIVFGLFIIALVSRSFTRVETNIEPWKPTTKIVSSGVFAYSRNPVYSAFCLVVIGAGCVLNSVWLLISFLPSAILVYHVAITKEEAYLEQKFGEQYLSYKRKVRCWI